MSELKQHKKNSVEFQVNSHATYFRHTCLTAVDWKRIVGKIAQSLVSGIRPKQLKKKKLSVSLKIKLMSAA